MILFSLDINILDFPHWKLNQKLINENQKIKQNETTNIDPIRVPSLKRKVENSVTNLSSFGALILKIV